jgi:hypothetical protein
VFDGRFELYFLDINDDEDDDDGFEGGGNLGKL